MATGGVATGAGAIALDGGDATMGDEAGGSQRRERRLGFSKLNESESHRDIIRWGDKRTLTSKKVF